MSRHISDKAFWFCSIREKLEEFFEFDRQDHSQFFCDASGPRPFDHIGHKQRIPDWMTGDRKTIGGSAPIDLGRSRVHGGTAKPVPCVIKVIVDAMNDTVNIGCIARGNLLHNSMRLIHSTCRNEEQTAYAPWFWTVCPCEFMIFGHRNPLNQLLIRHRFLGRKSRQLRLAKKIGDERGVRHSGIFTTGRRMYSTPSDEFCWHCCPG
jgi:hypothetical protein